MSLLATSPFVGTIGVLLWFLAAFCVGIAFFLFMNPPSVTNESKNRNELVSISFFTCRERAASEESIEASEASETVEDPIGAKTAKEKIVYSVTELRKRKKKTQEISFFTYSIIQIYQNTRSATPVVFQTRDHSATNGRHYSARSASPMIFYTAGEKLSNSRSSTPAIRRSVDLTGDDSHSKTPEELMDYYHDDPSTLPKGDLLGRIQWMHQNNGRIRAIGRVLSSRDLFFHFKDVELKDGQVLNVGDRVLFEISIYKNLVCATHIRKVENTRSKSTVNTPSAQE